MSFHVVCMLAEGLALKSTHGYLLLEEIYHSDYTSSEDENLQKWCKAYRDRIPLAYCCTSEIYYVCAHHGGLEEA